MVKGHGKTKPNLSILDQVSIFSFAVLVLFVVMAAVVPWQFNLFPTINVFQLRYYWSNQAGSFCKTGLSRRDMNF